MWLSKQCTKVSWQFDIPTGHETIAVFQAVVYRAVVTSTRTQLLPVQTTINHLMLGSQNFVQLFDLSTVTHKPSWMHCKQTRIILVEIQNWCVLYSGHLPPSDIYSSLIPADLPSYFSLSHCEKLMQNRITQRSGAWARGASGQAHT